jgi:hypothetical protein
MYVHQSEIAGGIFAVGTCVQFFLWIILDIRMILVDMLIEQTSVGGSKGTMGTHKLRSVMSMPYMGVKHTSYIRRIVAMGTLVVGSRLMQLLSVFEQVGPLRKCYFAIEAAEFALFMNIFYVCLERVAADEGSRTVRTTCHFTVCGLGVGAFYMLFHVPFSGGGVRALCAFYSILLVVNF